MANVARQKRQQAEVERTRSLILESAARVFAKNGYQASTMAAIAKEAGYTAPTLYTYFKGKSDIFDDLVDLTLGSIAAVYEEHEPAGMTFCQRLELLILRQFKVIDQYSDVFAFFMTLNARGETGPTSPRRRKRQYSDVESLRQQMTNWLGSNLQGSEYAHLNASLVEVYVQGVIRSFASRWAEGDQTEPLAKKISVVMPLILGGLDRLAQQPTLI